MQNPRAVRITWYSFALSCGSISTLHVIPEYLLEQREEIKYFACTIMHLRRKSHFHSSYCSKHFTRLYANRNVRLVPRSTPFPFNSEMSKRKNSNNNKLNSPRAKAHTSMVNIPVLYFTQGATAESIHKIKQVPEHFSSLIHVLSLEEAAYNIRPCKLNKRAMKPSLNK